MAMYLKITDGTTTIDLLGNDTTNSFNLLLGSWGPAVAKRRRGQLGGNWAEDVVETIPLYVRSDTDAATVLANIDTLTALIDQARRWALGGAVDPVIIRYSPNSASVYLQAAILGPPDDGPAVLLPPTFSDDLYQNAVDGVTLQFKRRGLWLGAEDAQSSTATAEPGKMTATFSAALTQPSPVDIQVAVDGSPSVAAASHSGYAIFVDDASDIVILEGEAATQTNFTTHVDAGASGGNVAKMDTGVTTGSLAWASPALNADARLFAIFALVRTNGTGDFDVRYLAQPAAPQLGDVINLFSYGPTPLFMGLVRTNEPLTNVSFRVETDSSVTSGNEIEVDYVAVVAMRENTRVIGISEFSQFSTFHREDHYFLHRLLTNPQSIYYQYNGSKNLYVGYQGILPSMMSSAALTAVIMVGGGNGTTWNTGEDYILTATRRPAYLVPR